MDQPNDDQDVNWSYKNETDQTKELNAGASEPGQSISWTGSEFIASEKNALWYLYFSIFMIILCALVYLFSKDVLSVIFIIIVGFLFIIIASRKPKQINFLVDGDGIKVGSRLYDYGQFKSFSVQQHDAISYISLLPLHRFQNELSIYYPPEQEEKILKTLAIQIPHDQRKENLIDKLAKLIRF